MSHIVSDPTPHTIVIFGASGDLAKRKLIPALFTLYLKERLPKNFNIIGQGRTVWDDETFRQEMAPGISEFVTTPHTADQWTTFAARLHYVHGDLTAATHYTDIEKTAVALEGEKGHRLYYLAIPPRFFINVVNLLGAAGMTAETESSGWRRVIIEKPFGNDLASAKALNAAILATLQESQIYRIDHYLAKETVQNLLVFRFGNTIFEPLWNRNYIDHVQITAAEAVAVGHRGGYYDQSGVLRDMFQNHLMQLLALVSMEPPTSFEADAIRNEKSKVLAAVRPIPHNKIASGTVRAQYEGYLQTEEVTADSQTPTFAAIRLRIDNWRWQGVPFYLRSGKALAEKTTQIIIQFKQPPHMMFPLPADQELRANLLIIRIQPEEGIHLRFEAKVPDTDADMRSVDMSFNYAASFDEADIPEAYEKLLLEALEGDASLFTRGDGIELAWGIIDPIINAWQTDVAPPMATYKPGSWGPEEANKFMRKNGRKWRYG